MYTIDSLPQIQPVKTNASDKTLLVGLPKASPAYNHRYMVYTDAAHTLRHYTQNVWVEPPAQLIHPLLVQALLDSHQFHAVIASPYGGRSDYHLDTELITLKQDFTVTPSEVTLTLQVRLIDSQAPRIIASRRFSAVVKTPENDARGAAIATNQASSQLIAQITEFVHKAIP